MAGRIWVLKKNNRGQATEKIEEEEKTTKDEKLFILRLKYEYN